MKICPKCNNTYEEGTAYCPLDNARLTSISKMQAAGYEVPPEAIAAVEREHEELNSPDEKLVGRMIANRYKILKLLGEGGMGVVYRAIDERLEKQVAIKILKEDFATRQDVVARFTQEAKSAARIKHENVLDVTDYGQTEDGSFYIAMELLVGTDVADVLQQAGALDLNRALTIMIQVTRALSAAHAKGIVHRDLKPENIFLVSADDAREIVKIVDFGIAKMKDETGATGGRKLTQTGMIFGTPEYMSPEQAAGKAMDHRVDIYAVGIILYELLAGRVPFVGESFMGVLTQHMFEAAPPIKSLNPNAEVTPEVEAILNRALAKDPSFRYQSMQELTDDLVRLRDGMRPAAISAVIPGPPARPNLSGQFAVVPSGLYQAIPPSSHTGVHSSIPTPTMPDTPSAKYPPAKQGSSKGLVVLLAGVALLLLGVASAAVARTMSAANNGAPTATATVVVSASAPTATATASVAPTASAIATATASATAAPSALASVAPSASASAVASALPSAVASASAGASAAPSAASVSLHVSTVPSGAHIEVDSHPGLGCAATPCDLRVPVNEALRIVATAPRKRAELVFTAERDGQDVSLTLTAVGGASPTARPAPAQNGNARRPSPCRPGQLQYFDRRDMIYRPCT